jgi:hypothetical protein
MMTRMVVVLIGTWLLESGYGLPGPTVPVP